MQSLSKSLPGKSTLLSLLAVVSALFVPALLPAPAAAQAVTIVQTSTRYAGTGVIGFNGDFGSDTSVNLAQPSYMALDSLGNQYFSDTGDNCVRRVDMAGNITTVAGLVVTGQGDTCNSAGNTAPTTAQGLLRPTGLVLDAANNLYIADTGHNCVRRLAVGSTGTANLTVAAGTCTTVTTASGTPVPSGLVLDGASNLFVALQDTADGIYQVVRQSVSAANSTVVNQASRCLVAGTPSALTPATCAGITDSVVLNAPSGLAINTNGSVFVADTGNNCVRQVVGGTAQTTTIGLCANDNTGTSQTALHQPFGLAFSRINSLFVSETGPDNVFRYISTTGVLSRAVGLPSGTAGAYTSAQDGISALNVPLNQPRGIVFDANNNFYLADSANNIIRMLNINEVFPQVSEGNSSNAQPITFVINTASNLTVTPGPDYVITSNTCNGPQTPAAAGNPPNTCQVFVRFAPTRPGIRYSPLTVTDSVSNTLVAQGLQAVGTGPFGAFDPGTVNTVAPKLNHPSGIATDSAGNAYVLEAGSTAGTADVRIITPAGTTSTLSVKAGTGLVSPSGIAGDAAGNWYVVDSAQGTVARFGADGSINTAYASGLTAPSAIYVDGFGNLYVAQQGGAHNVVEIYGSGLMRTVAGSGTDPAANNVPAAGAQFSTPAGLFIDLNGVLYIADSGTHRVYAIDNSGLIHLLAGNGTTTTTNANSALGTGLISPTSIAVDAAGDVYIADSAANKVYTVTSTSAGSNISVVLGTGVAGNTGDGGASPLATVNGPLSVALDSTGDLFVVDAGNMSVREITYPSPTLNFGNVNVGSTSPVQVQFFGNIGTSPLNLLNAIGTSDPHFTVDSATTTCGTAILSGQTCAIGYKFAPTAATSYAASSLLQSNSINSPEIVTLLATGRIQLNANQSSTSETEVYGSPFPEVTTFAPAAGNPAVTGTLTYTYNGVTLCTTSGTLSPTSTCNAGNSGLSVGSYTVAVNYSGDSNYAASASTVTLTVMPAPLTVTVNNQSRPYGQPNPTLTGTLTGVVNNDTILAAYSTTANQLSPAGTYAITATLTATGASSLANYTITNTPGTLTVTQAALTVSVLNVSRQYGSPNPPFTNTVSGALPGDVFTFTYGTTATQSSPVGQYPITLTVSGPAAANYSITVVPGTLTVTPAPLTVTVANATRPYGQPNPTFTGTISGAVNGDTFQGTLSTTATITSPPGAYPITETVTGANLSNYTVTNNPGTLTITKATTNLQVTANNVSRLYGQPNPTFTSTVTGALNGDTFTITYTTTATVTSPVGTYAIVPTVSGPAAANYNITTTNGTLTVTPAPLSVTANNATRAYGSANPLFTGTVTGLVNGDTVTTTYATSATPSSAVGTYAIVPTVTGAVLSNYTLTTTNGTLTVTQAVLTVTITPNNATRIYGTPNPIFTGVVSGTVNGDVITATLSTAASITSPVGNYPIIATLSGANAANYTAIVVPATLTITGAPTSTVLTTSSSSTASGGAITFTATVSSAVTAAVGPPNGTVNFFSGGVQIGTGTVTNGVATFTTSALPNGTSTITATYVPANGNFLPSSSNSIPQVVFGIFTLSATPPTQLIRGAGTTVYNVTVTSQQNFTGPVALNCFGLPADATCTFSTQVVTLTAGGAQTVQMNVTTTVADAKLLIPAQPGRSINFSPIAMAAALPFELSGFTLMFAGLGVGNSRRRKTMTPRHRRLLLLLACTLGMLGLAGCGCPNTAFKTYNIVISGTAVNGTAPSANATVELSVGL